MSNQISFSTISPPFSNVDTNSKTDALEINNLIYTQLSNYQTEDYQIQIADLIKRRAIRNGGWTILSRKCDICIKQLPSAQHLVPHRFTHTFDLGYTCLTCHKTYDKKKLFFQHLRRHKYIPTDNNSFLCLVCNKTFVEKASLLRHLQSPIHRKDILYKCPVCNWECNTSSELTAHKRSHATDALYECDICLRRYTNKFNRNRHRRKHTNTEPKQYYKCDICRKQFASLKWRNEHRAIHSGAPAPYKCDLCEKLFYHSTSIIAHKKMHDDKRYKCDICLKQFRTKGILTNHNIIHTQVKNHSCDICHKSFGFKTGLADHMKTHTGERNHKCALCDKRFSLRCNLTTHVKRRHVAEKTIECKICNKMFKLPTDLTSHLELHTGTRQKVACELCPIRCDSNSRLVEHMRTHTGEKPFACRICSKRFSSRNIVTRHETTIHVIKQRKYECDICTLRFFTKPTLTAHRSRHSREGHIECDICRKLCKSAFIVFEHKQLAHGISPDSKFFQCAICSKSFSVKGTLTLHMRIHQEERPRNYECDICKVRYFTYANRERHRANHEKEGRHECDICRQLFPEERKVVKHKERAHGIWENRIYKCDICGSQYKDRKYFQNHLRTHHRKA